jgi:hypothetical protein
MNARELKDLAYNELTAVAKALVNSRRMEIGSSRGAFCMVSDEAVALLEKHGFKTGKLIKDIP